MTNEPQDADAALIASLIAASPRIPPAELARIRRIRAMRDDDLARKAN